MLTSKSLHYGIMTNLSIDAIGICLISARNFYLHVIQRIQHPWRQVVFFIILNHADIARKRYSSLSAIEETITQMFYAQQQLLLYPVLAIAILSLCLSVCHTDGLVPKNVQAIGSPNLQHRLPGRLYSFRIRKAFS